MFCFELLGTTSWLGEKTNSILLGTEEENRGPSVAGTKKVRKTKCAHVFGSAATLVKKARPGVFRNDEESQIGTNFYACRRGTMTWFSEQW